MEFEEWWAKYQPEIIQFEDADIDYESIIRHLSRLAYGEGYKGGFEQGAKFMADIVKGQKETQ